MDVNTNSETPTIPTTTTIPTYSIPPPLMNQDMYDFTNNILTNPILLIVIAVVIGSLVYLTLGKQTSADSSYSSASTSSSSFFGNGSSNGNSSSSESSSGSTIFLIIAIGVFAAIVFLIGAPLFNTTLSASLQNTTEATPELDIVVDQSTQEAPFRKKGYGNQVFNIPGNYYGYEDAKLICDAYGSRLASYDEVETAYNSGGEWCNYGWSEGQNALFPTQKATFKGLQKIKGHEHDCGRPGINGGYIANPHVKFGVNCYGKKPPITQEEEELMETASPYPKTQKDYAMDQRVNYWKSKLDEILVSPFNYNSWSTM